MKIPSDKKLVDLYCYVPRNEYIPLLSFLRKELPGDVSLEDVVLTETYHPADDGGQESRGTSSLNICYFISKSSHDKKVLKEQISDEEKRLANLKKEIKLKKIKLAKLKEK
jgi:hypothetical protein